MAKRRIQEQEIADWVLARRKGQSFRSIARAYKVDARTVQAWVRRAGEEKEKEHWEAVSRQVDAGRLDEHYRMLLLAATSLLQVSHSDPLRVSPGSRVEPMVDEAMRSGLAQAAGILKGRGLDLNRPAGSHSKPIGTSESPGVRMGRRLLQALFDHEPQLETAFKQWAKRWDSFQRARQELNDDAGNLLGQKKMPGPTAAGLKAKVVQEALDRELLGDKARSTRVEPGNDGEAALYRLNKTNEALILRGPRSDVDAVASAYEDVLKQVSHPERMAPVKQGYQSAIESMHRVEDLIDRLILVGRPQGRCSLCPQYAGLPVKSGVTAVKP